MLTADFAKGQNTDYFMRNGKVYDCRGNFFDSDLGITKGDYAHNEDLTFTICVKNAASITLTFSKFCTEKIEDYLIVYDGPDTTSKKLSGKLSGTKNPGSFTSSDSCLTFYFHSDKSVSCDGWVASWSTKVKPLPNPKFISSPKASCKDSRIGVRFDQKFNCDSIKIANFTVTGPGSPTISSITPIGCNSNRLTDSFQINFSSPLDKGGTYRFAFDAIKLDACDSAWKLHGDTVFAINDCPILVELTANPDTVCTGSCTDIIALVTGGDSSKYMFKWTPAITGTFGPNNYCPKNSGWVSLTVSDGISIPGSDSIWIEVVSPPVAQKDTTVCQSNPEFSLTAGPAGGQWKGRGITDSISGKYLPAKAGAGLDTVLYKYAGCIDDVIVNVRAIDAGLPNAACPGTSSFMVTGFSPPGGTWSGTNMQSNGQFDPKDTGTFVVTYTWSGCSDDKEINVYPLSIPQFDTICQSTPNKQLVFSPLGGVWSGVGFVNNYDGLFYPPSAGAGVKNLIYSMNGCKDTLQMNVIGINALWDQIACPDATPFDVYTATPAGGIWTGVGIIDSIKGTYDGSFIYGLNRTWYNDSLRYTVNGCVDVKMVYVRKVNIGLDTISFCIEDDSLLLDYNSTRFTVWGGKWSGPGILGNYFNPSRAGYGVHKVFYDAYGCRDSIILQVYPAVNIQADTSICVSDAKFTLRNDVNGGRWKGIGVIDSIVGVFDPNIAGVGVHNIVHTSPKGCLANLKVTVEAKPVVKISGYDPTYCLKDSNFTIFATPAGGTFSGVGLTGNNFRPRTAGTGIHQLNYQFGTATCFSRDSVLVQVLDTLVGALAIDDDSLCDGESAVLTATASRGNGGSYFYQWASSSSSSRTLFSKPATTSWQKVTFSDGCSDEYSDSVLIHVFPKVEVTVASSPIQCYGTQGFAEVNPKFADPYKITWFTNPLQYSARIDVPVANSYRFKMANLNTGCFLDSSVYVESHPQIKAHFITTPPVGRCLNPFDPILNIIDFTNGADSGMWIFGDGDTLSYTPGLNPSHVYPADTNIYPIWLHVSNSGGCKDSFSSEVCLDDSVYLYIPTAFSPGTDGLNDVYRIRGAGVTVFRLEIYNRWGERVFYTTQIEQVWDGKYKDKLVDKGAYGYVIEYKGKKTTLKSTFGTLQVLR